MPKTYPDDAPKKWGIGIDFGTSNSAAAIYDGTKVSLIQLERTGLVMPSASYIDTQFSAATGQQAIDTYIQANRGRKVELSAEVLGEARSSTGEIDAPTGLPTDAATTTIYGQDINDASLPGRLFRGTKRLLGAVAGERITVFRKPFRLVALITPVLLRIRLAIREVLRRQQGPASEADHACIGHPVNFEGNANERNTLALRRLSESYRHAGISHQNFCPEPIAATISYLHTTPAADSERVLTVDFGGGTLDLCIVRQQLSDFAIEAVHGIALGGDKIDQAVFKEVLFPLLGKGERWTRVVEGAEIDTLFPFESYENLLINWPISYVLNQNKYTTPVINQMNGACFAAIKFKRLYELITQNLSYEVFQAIRELKERLSSESSAVLDIPEINVKLTVERSDFELLIADLLQSFEVALTTTLKKAQLEASEIDIVLRTGGSSLIPAFRRILDQHFPGKVVEHDPFTSVAAGLAIADYRRELGESRHGNPGRIENWIGA